MKIPAYVKQVPGAETPSVRISRPIAVGRGTDSRGTLVRLRRLASFRKSHLRGGGVDG